MPRPAVENVLRRSNRCSHDGDEAPLHEYAAIFRRPGASIVDEAHAVGVYGERGRPHRGIRRWRTTFPVGEHPGKALGVSGAFVAGPAWAIDYLSRAHGRSSSRRRRPRRSPPRSMRAWMSSRTSHSGARRCGICANCAHGWLKAGVAVGRDVAHRAGHHWGQRHDGASPGPAGNWFDVRAIRPPTVPPGRAPARS